MWTVLFLNAVKLDYYFLFFLIKEMFKSLGYFFTLRCLEMYFYLQGCIKLMKSDNKDFYIIMKIIFQTNAVLLNFLFIEYSWKKNKKQHNCF